ncbi:unnamed protein product [Paramecium primaurelia]|uniref:Transmembrane protein n=1 Tax=Paramecium primaurelia TaxID=5886 RepID=A0A8S1LSV8_PARPR|nr:unnamed protein product [Paramecium primaurelia]
MLKQVKCNAITVDPFVNRKSMTPNPHNRSKTDRIKQQNLVSEKTADTLTSSISTLLHPSITEVKNQGATSLNVDKYLYKYFTPYRRFSEKKNGNKKLSPLNDNNIPCKVSSEIGSFRNSVQNIDNDQFSMIQSGTSNKEHQNQTKKMFCNSQQKLKTLNIIQQKNKSNKKQETSNQQLVYLNQEQEQLETLQNEEILIYHPFQEEPKKQSSIQNQSQNSKKSIESDKVQDQGILELQKFDSETMDCYVKQFRVQIKKTIILNQNQTSIIKQYQNSGIQADIQEEINQQNNYYQQQELENIKFNQAKSEILKQEQGESRLSNLNTKKRRFQIKFLFHFLIVILFIIFYSLIV